ncbi:hypothetical protein RI578_06685 [Streptomyces sp. BB1-1-1]|uniref:hypothetical protein n=1 Tax=Streptomyces sp. BB1-1-1 TaxID=3074430 RepID=UPI0028779DCB|nr:hypothetical protein [Streptomyces sp. BB1-1-1]WND33999.1 hypothetical protein RI578_06685 [Streptomyces sp. BB1-1-1]
MNSAEPQLRTFVVQRDRDVSGISGEGTVAEGVQFSDGWVVTHWLDQPPMHEPKTDVWHNKGTHPVTKIHGHGGATRIVWLDEQQAQRARTAAHIAQAFGVPLNVVDPAAERQHLQDRIGRALATAAQSSTWGEGGEPRWTHLSGDHGDFVNAVMETVDQLVEQRTRAQRTAGRAYQLADRWEAAHGLSMFLVRAAGAELRDELDGTEECDHRLKPMLSGIVNGGQCVKRGLHDEHETADGTKFSPIRPERPQPQPAIPWTGPAPDWADGLRAALAGSCSNPDHACITCGDCVYEHPREDSCTVGQLPPSDVPIPTMRCVPPGELTATVGRVLGIDTTARPANVGAWLMTACRELDKSETARERLNAERSQAAALSHTYRNRAERSEATIGRVRDLVGLWAPRLLPRSEAHHLLTDLRRALKAPAAEPCATHRGREERQRYGCNGPDPADQDPPNQGPLTGIEVRDPCPFCEGCPLIPRTLMDYHVREHHPEVREGGPGIPVHPADDGEVELARAALIAHVGDDQADVVDRLIRAVERRNYCDLPHEMEA